MIADISQNAAVPAWPGVIGFIIEMTDIVPRKRKLQATTHLGSIN